MQASDRQPRTLQRGKLLALLAVAVVVASVFAPPNRVGETQTLGGGSPGPATGAVGDGPSTGDTPTGVASRGGGAPLSPQELSPQELALLAMACPSSLESMPPRMRKAMAGAGRSHLVPPYRQTAARTPGEWLIETDEWYTPEDQTRARPAEDKPASDASVVAAPQQAQPQQVEPKKAQPQTPEPPRSPAEPPKTERTEAERTGTERARTEPPPPPALELPRLPADEPPAYEPPIEPPPAGPPAAAMAPIPMTPIPAGQKAVEATLGDEPAVDLPPAPPELADQPTMAPAVEVEPEAIPSPQREPVAGDRVPPVSPPPEEVSPPAPEREAEPIQTPPKPRLFAPPQTELPPPAIPAVPSKLFDRPDVTAPPQRQQRQQHQQHQPPVGPPASPHSQRAKPLTKAEQQRADAAHLELFAKNHYPSARECGECHKRQYDEWRVSSHAYAYVSPMFHKFEQKLYDISLGTVGYFCMRCHSPTAVAMSIPRDTPLWDMPLVAREGVTCIACHRVNEHYSKANGERRVVPGDLHAPVYGGIGGDGVAKAIADKAKYKVKTSPDERGAGQAIHTQGRFFHHLSQAEFCTSCHQVAVHPGVKLEVVWEQYRASPACKKGVTCQHCHMGTTPGVASPYEITSIAEVGGKSVNEQREHANHVFYGPGYSIAHPGVFPFNKKADRWAIHEWLRFDWRAGWGTEEFEDAVEDGKIAATFPEVWKEPDDRRDAREIIEDNQAALGVKTALRKQVMEHGSKVAGPFFKHRPRVGEPLKFNYVVTNLNEGHNLPTASLGAQPQLWANVVLIGPTGERLWETGYTDSYGDLADIHSVDVRHGRLRFDSQLFNLQTMFLITGATGTDREFFLPVNVSIDQVPQLRPGAVPVSVLNHPPFIRMEGRSIAPLGSKRVKYSVPAKLITTPGRYRLSFRMRSRTEPIYFMRFCESTVEMQRAMNEGILDIHPYSVEFVVE